MSINRKTSHEELELYKLDMKEEEFNFRERVHDQIFRILEKCPRTFNDILKRALNCDPAFLLKSLQGLREAELILQIEEDGLPSKYSLNLKNKFVTSRISNCEQSFCRFRKASGGPKTQHIKELVENIINSLPESTPVYSQWWFSQFVYKRLIELLLKLTEDTSSVAFIGASTLGAIFSHFYSDIVCILDVDEILLKEIKEHSSKTAQAIQYNVSTKPDRSFINKFNVVLVDPPWSTHQLETFLVRSSMFVSIGGNLLISFPPILTRPSAERERKDLIRLAENLGLSLKLELPGFTEYSVPLFEQRAYDNYGIHLKEPWRKGDLFLFTKTSNSSIDTTYLIEKTYEWNQYSFNGCRLFLKRDGNLENGPPSIEPIPGLEDYIYKSTSSRMPSWKSASLISTRNSVANAKGRKKLSFLLENISEYILSSHERNVNFDNIIAPEIRKAFLSMLKGTSIQKAGVVE